MCLEGAPSSWATVGWGEGSLEAGGEGEGSNVSSAAAVAWAGGGKGKQEYGGPAKAGLGGWGGGEEEGWKVVEGPADCGWGWGETRSVHIGCATGGRRGAYALLKQIVQGDARWGAWLQSPERGLLWALFLLN